MTKSLSRGGYVSLFSDCKSRDANCTSRILFSPIDASLSTLSTDGLGRILNLVLDSVDSPSTKRNYRTALVDFLTWYRATGQTVFNRATLQAYGQSLKDCGKGGASINLRLSAIRKLATEAADNGLIDPAIASGIQNVKGVRLIDFGGAVPSLFPTGAQLQKLDILIFDPRGDNVTIRPFGLTSRANTKAHK